MWSDFRREVYRFHSEQFYGCNFLKACAEYSQQNNPIFQCAAGHKENMRQLIEQNLDLKNDQQKLQLSREIALLVDGSIVYAQSRGDLDVALTAKKWRKDE